MYQPIAEVALEAKLRIVPTNLPLATARMMRSAGLAALEPRVTRALGLDRIGFTIYSLPREVQARIDYLQMIAEQILSPVSPGA